MNIRRLPITAALLVSFLSIEAMPANAMIFGEGIPAPESALPTVEAQWHHPHRHRCRWVNVRTRGWNGRWYWRRVWRCW